VVETDEPELLQDPRYASIALIPADDEAQLRRLLPPRLIARINRMRSRFDIAAAAQDTSLRLLRRRVQRAEAAAGDAVAEAMRVRAELRRLSTVTCRDRGRQRAIDSDVKGWQDECDRLGRLLRRERVDHDTTRDELRSVRDEASGAWRELV